MKLWLDEYANLNSPLHRWNPRVKLIALFALIFAFAFVQDLRLVPVMVAVTAALYALSRLPVSFLSARLRYPGLFLLVMAVILPFFAGETILLQLGPLALRQEGLLSFLLIAARFVCILTVGLVLFGTAPFLTTIKTMRGLGLSPILADMMLLSFRYLFEIADTLATMERAMRLRGFRAGRLSIQGLRTLASLAGSILVRSYEQSERIYHAMKLRGYGHEPNQPGEVAVSPDQGTTIDGEPEPVLTVSGMQLSYPNRPPVLQDVNLVVKQGERVGLIGPNGAGKTTLFLVICGLLEPEAGESVLFGQAVANGDFRPAVGLVFQNPSDQLFSPSVWDDVAFGPINMGLPEEEVEIRVSEALATAGVLELADRLPHHLSGGEKRMVSIAGVLAMRPRLILYDEPGANLDARSRRRLIRFLQASEQAILIASHDLELILEVCERVILIDEGRIVADDDPRILMDDATLMEAHGLEKPHSLVPHADPHHER